MENEIDKLYPEEIPQEEQSEKNYENNNFTEDEPSEKQYSVPSDFKYTPVEIPHRIDWFVVLLAWIILGILGYVLFTTSVFE